ncbi:MAG: methyltransferase domain-containing protein [Bacteroidetes bacterium]|nr:methyltransferase domain-containing protein [Bacteroidota bacterium]
MNESDKKQSVQFFYTAIAEHRLSCCDFLTECCQPHVSSTNEQHPTPYPLEKATFGLNCGSPIDYAELVSGLTVLDLGCGAGIDVFRAATIVAPTGIAIGLDMTDAMLNSALETKEKNGICNTIFLKGDIEAIPLPSSSVDRVMSNCVINLAPDKRKVFSEIFRVLKRGGLFSIADIVTYGVVPNDLRETPELWCSCISGALEKDIYLHIITETGFTDVTVLQEHPYSSYIFKTFTPVSLTVKARKP